MQETAKEKGLNYGAVSAHEYEISYTTMNEAGPHYDLIAFPNTLSPPLTTWYIIIYVEYWSKRSLSKDATYAAAPYIQQIMQVLVKARAHPQRFSWFTLPLTPSLCLASCWTDIHIHFISINLLLPLLPSI